jgi:hypothetical protein
MPTLALYPFCFRHPLTGDWVRARHKMQVPELQRHYAEWALIGAPEIRHIRETGTQPFNPFEPALLPPQAPTPLVKEKPIGSCRAPPRIGHGISSSIDIDGDVLSP